MRTTARPHLLHRRSRGVMNPLDIFAGELGPVIGFENPQSERIYFPGWTANAVAVVFNHEQDREFSFFRETNSFEKIALASRGVADRGHDNVLFPVQLNAPSKSTCRKKLRTSWRRHAPYVQINIAVM